jgi:uncharacterized protein with HEPN domain
MSRNPRLYLQELIGGTLAILTYAEGMAKEEFIRDQKTLDACIRRFQILGEAAKNLPNDWKESEPKIPWQDVVNFRNLLVHEYFRIDETLLWNTIQQDLEPLLTACQRIQERLENQTNPE